MWGHVICHKFLANTVFSWPPWLNLFSESCFLRVITGVLGHGTWRALLKISEYIFTDANIEKKHSWFSENACWDTSRSLEFGSKSSLVPWLWIWSTFSKKLLGIERYYAYFVTTNCDTSRDVVIVMFYFCLFCWCCCDM